MNAVKHSIRPANASRPAVRRAYQAGPRPQLELSLAPARRTRTAPRPAPPARAAWWFQRMREVVDVACDWQPAPSPQPQEA